MWEQEKARVCSGYILAVLLDKSMCSAETYQKIFHDADNPNLFLGSVFVVINSSPHSPFLRGNIVVVDISGFPTHPKEKIIYPVKEDRVACVLILEETENEEEK